MKRSKKRKIVVSDSNRELIDSVVNAACQFYSVSKKELLNESSLVGARHLCFYIIKVNTDGIYDYTIGHFFNKKRTAVQYGINVVEHQKEIYRQMLGDINSISDIANNFEKKYTWHLRRINTTA